MGTDYVKLVLEYSCTNSERVYIPKISSSFIRMICPCTMMCYQVVYFYVSSVFQPGESAASSAGLLVGTQRRKLGNNVRLFPLVCCIGACSAFSSTP